MTDEILYLQKRRRRQKRRSMKIKPGDTVILNDAHIMKETAVTILRELPALGGRVWEAVVVNGTARTWVRPNQIERKL